MANKRKIHHYGARRDKSMTLIGKDGRRMHKNIEAVLSAITDPGARAQAKTYIKNAHEDKERLTLRSLEAKMAFSRERKFLINAGFTEESFQEEYGFTYSDFEDEDNWVVDAEGRRRFVWKDKVYDLRFDYSGRILERV